MGIRKIHNILASEYPDNCSEIYIRVHGICRLLSGQLLIYQGGTISTDTYMNAFDIGTWKKYTYVSNLSLVWKFKGKGIIKVIWEREKEGAICLGEKNVESCKSGYSKITYYFENLEGISEGILYFNFYAEADTLLESWFEIGEGKWKEVKISLVICTYKRREQLEKTLGMLLDEYKKESWDNWLQVVVIDNASELENHYENTIKIYKNVNTGGSGGFSRGMEETVKNLDFFPATHVLLMDDDVILQMESLYRLHGFLALMKEKYVQEMVAGRMFRMDRPHIQYTAVEIWNKGDIRHIGWNQDMMDRQCLWDMNENRDGEYGGWWFACFPIEFVKENKPVPFFLHCDDVEYGLRHGGMPIILNGIQVWHETYEYRQSPLIAYYDTRNPLFVNELYGMRTLDMSEIHKWMNKITEVHVKGDYLTEYMIIRGVWDYLKGEKWLEKCKGGNLHKKLMDKKGNRVQNAIFWRLTYIRWKKKLYSEKHLLL